ncbi:PhnD/SsuA/transferrin family substrate-binding protein [Rhodospirillum sp. A1_3_36]|uniref:PhnD/SsuA/transferrin family substrate-binding protein n=1 Tax=Rhodospirillum sp. A1_3_36 TaxID=3391666 RepID=UPI0039A69E71
MGQALTRRAAMALGGALCATVTAKRTFALSGAAPPVARFGLTSVVVKENLAFFSDWAAYLERRLGRPVVFVQRRSYHEVMELLERGDVQFAWICGYPYSRPRSPEYLDLLAVPLWNGAPLYQSYIIGRADGDMASLEDLRGRIFAYSDPDSNSGYLVPRQLLAEKSRDFFRRAYRPDFSLRPRIFRSPVFGLGRAGCKKEHMVAAIQLIKEKLSSRRHATSSFHGKGIVFR